MARLEYRTISHRTVHALPVGDKDAVYWDRKLQGFGVRVYPSGTKVYLVQTRAGGKSKRVAIGRHGIITSEQARAKATQIIARIKAGEDPDPDAAKPAPVRLPSPSSPSAIWSSTSMSGASRGRSRRAAGW